MNENARYCETLVREADRDRYLAALFAPPDKRGALHALAAVNIELARVRDQAREPMPGEIRLQWWREVIEGKRDDEARAHPVAAALLDAIAAFDLPPERLEATIDARAFDLYDAPFETIAEWERYAEDTEGILIAYAMQVLAGPQPTVNAELPARAARSLAGLTVLQRLPLHLSRGQCYVAREMLDHFGARLEDGLAGRITPEWRAALAELRLRIRRDLDAAADLVDGMSQTVLPALLPCAAVRPSLRIMEPDSCDPLRPEGLSPWRRQWLIWRAARNPKRIFG
jgi:phytoene synthase